MQAQVKKVGGGSDALYEQPEDLMANPAKSDIFEKATVVSRPTRKYNMRQPRSSRTRNGLQSRCEPKDIKSPALRKPGSTRETKETLPPRTIDEQ